MKRSFALKVGSLILVGVSTASLTRAIVGQGGLPTPKGTISTKSVTRVQGDEVPSNPFGDITNSKRVVAHYRLDSYNVVVNGRHLTVSANTSLQSKQQGVVYVWTVSVIDATTKNVVFGNIYKNQVFSPRVGEVANPTFNEIIPLNRGNYEVKLDLSKISVNENIENWTLDDVGPGQSVLRAVKQVTVN